MARQTVLIDSGFLFELFDASQPGHEAAIAAIADTNIVPIIPQITLPEAAYLFQRSGGVRQSAAFLQAIGAFPADFAAVEQADFRRAREIMLQYESAKLDFVDCCLMALCERLNVTTVCTFDRRDFSMVRLKHTPHLTLLPETI